MFKQTAEDTSAAGPRIVAFAFESAPVAQEALLAATRLQEDGLITIHDVVFVTRPSRRAAHVSERTNSTPVAAAVPTSLAGAVIGTLIAGPIGFLIGGVLAGISGAFAAKLYDPRIPDRVIAQLRVITQPGQSMLALQVDDPHGTALIDELRRLRGAQLVYSLSPAAQVADALHGAPSPASAGSLHLESA